MPRKARIDAPGALHHIIVRGIRLTVQFFNSQLPHYGVLIIPHSYPGDRFSLVAEALKIYAEQHSNGLVPYIIRLRYSFFVTSPSTLKLRRGEHCPKKTNLRYGEIFFLNNNSASITTIIYFSSYLTLNIRNA